MGPYFFYISTMELVFKKSSPEIERAKRRLLLLVALFYVVGIVLMMWTGMVIIPSIIIGVPSAFVIRLIQLNVPVKIRDGKLIQRTANLNWFDEVELVRIRKIEHLPTVVPRSALKTMFTPVQGVKLYYNTYDEIIVECDSPSFLEALQKEAPQAEFVQA